MIALFDMDGTLFPGDSQLRFAARVVARRPWRRLYLLLVLPAAVLAAVRLLRAETLKRLFLCYLWGMTREQIQNEARAFAEEDILPILYPEVKERLEAHRRAGDTCILVSASPDFYTAPIASLLRFDAVVATPFNWGETMPFLPAVPPPGNNKGANKVIRLRQRGLIPAAVPIPESAAYTDSRADLPMLDLCERAVLVNPSRRLVDAVGNAAVDILRPACPWKSRAGHFLFIVRSLFAI